MTPGSCSRSRALRHLCTLAVLALAGCGQTGGQDRPEAGAVLLAPGPPAGVYAGIASTVARGYDEAEGVHLAVRRGEGGAHALATGGATFAVLDLNELARAPDAVAVMAIVETPLLAFLRRPVPSGAAVRAAWGPPLAQAVRHLPGTALARWDLAPPRRAVRVEDAGVPAYPELVVATARETLRDQPAVVRATVAALARGYRFTVQDPDSSAEDLLARFPGADAAAIRGQLDRLDTAFVGDEGAPGILDEPQIAAWSRWARAHGLPARVATEPRYARAAASADQG